MDIAVAAGAPAEGRAIAFHGRWQDYLSMALVNLLLTIVTLGIYRFWATARTRRFLWSHTRVIDSDLEWTGTGGEMFVGFLMAMGVLIGWGVVVTTAGILGGDILSGLAIFAFYLFMLWAFGFAQFRALRYRLSRTWWRGIRGGSDDNGVTYGWTALGNNIAAGLTAGILTPRALVNNWNDRMNAMSFGPHMLESDVDTDGLMRRWLLVYPVYGLFLLLFFLPGVMTSPDGEPRTPWLLFGTVLAMVVAVTLALASFWALFFRKVAATFRMGGLSAEFPVPTRDWLKFYAKLLAITLVTFGLASIMWRYWQWRFVIDRLWLYGEVDLDRLTQSTTTAPRDAEGLADAFDIGAF